MDTRVPFAFLLPVALYAGCQSSTPAAQPTPGAPPLLLQDCDPIVPTECGFPFPSSVWTVPDSTTATGMRVAFGQTSLPKYDPAHHIDSTPFIARDGFSPGASIITHMPNATVTGLADPNHIEQSITTTSPTILMEYDTGKLVPHFAELDMLITTTDDARTFFIRPALRLKDATRYVVAIRHVVDASGTPLPVNPVFQALRDNSPNDDLSVAPRRALYADILGKLKANGIDTSDLQLAWDFTTASANDTTKYLVHMRDLALATVGNDGPAYTIDQVTDNPNAHIRRRLAGTMTVPLYLDQPGAGASLNLGADGLPAQNGTATFPFLVQIPNSVVDSGKPGAIVQNGHGLFGDQTEGENSFMAVTCDREGYVEIAVDLEGMAADDVNYVTNVIAGDVSQFKHVVDRLHQGFINELLAMRMMMGKMSMDPQTIFNGKPTIDPTTRFYRGDSQGGISGGVYMAISTDVTRGLWASRVRPTTFCSTAAWTSPGSFSCSRGPTPTRWTFSSASASCSSCGIARSRTGTSRTSRRTCCPTPPATTSSFTRPSATIR